MGPRHAFRMIPHALVVTLSLSLSIGASCSGAQGETENGGDDTEATPAGPRVESLDTVDTSNLSRLEKEVWEELVNERLSPCGEPVSVGRCVAEQRACGRCVPAARYLVRLIEEGYERQEIEDLYELRYAPDRAVEIDTTGAPTRGSPMAPITIVEYSDFECPYCGRAHPVLAQLLDEFDGRIRLVFQNYPLVQNHPRAMPAARAAVAAGNQGKFWEMHDLLFEHQRQLEDDDLIRYAEELELDMDRFRTDMQGAETQARIEREQNAGRELGVDGTPTFFINGRRYREPPSSLGAYIREALEE